MKNRTLSLLVAATLTAATAAQAEPSRLFSQETGETSKDLSIDLDYNGAPNSVGVAAGLRAGAFGGEMLVNSKTGAALDGSGFNTSNVGFKMGIGNGLAVYGILAYGKNEVSTPAIPPFIPATTTTVKSTDFAVGAAFTMRQGQNLLLNANAEIVTDDGGFNGRGDKNTLFIKLGGGYYMPATANGRFSFIGEAVIENSDFLDTVINLGMRWEPRKNATIDFVVFNERGDYGSSTGIPGTIRANFAF
jgi:hypothetical protein